MSETQATAGGKLKITLVKSAIGRPYDQGRAVKSLGLRRLQRYGCARGRSLDSRRGAQDQPPRHG